MPERGEHHPEPERDEDRPEEEGEEGYDAGEQLRRALEQERHLREARRRYEEAPLYRIRGEEDGTVSLSKKGYSYWPNRPPAAATQWCVLSKHPDWEAAERRLLRIASPPAYYDERGRLAQAPPSD
jgi:hypothetical protein